jgi:hypothetical protein
MSMQVATKLTTTVENFHKGVYDKKEEEHHVSDPDYIMKELRAKKAKLEEQKKLPFDYILRLFFPSLFLVIT